MMEAAGNGDTVTRSFYGIKIDLLRVSVACGQEGGGFCE